MLSIPHISRKHNAGIPVALAYTPSQYNPDINTLPMDSSYLSDSPSPANSTGHDHPASTKYHPSPAIGHRRMSEPASFSGATLYATVEPPTHSRYTHNNFTYNHPPRIYPSHLHRGCSTGSLRDLRHHHTEFTPPSEHPEWKHQHSLDARHHLFDDRGDGFDEPISPLQPNFSGGLAGSPTSGMPYSPISENPYGPSPPGTATSTSSSVAPMSAASGMPCSPSISIAQHLQRSMSSPNISAETAVAAVDRKTYSFVALPGNAVKKRPRRRYDEIERLYQCSWPDCTKAYGTLNHLNAHVTMQKHGSKRTPEGKWFDYAHVHQSIQIFLEFKEMRKQWRKVKKEQAAANLAMRRDSYGDAYDDPVGYAQSYLSHHPPHYVPRVHPLHEGLGLPSSVTIGTGERYTIPIEDIRYPPSNERDDGAGLGCGYENMISRNRYPGGLPSSWHGSSALSRSNLVHHQHQDSYGPSPAPQQHAHHSQLPHLAISANIPRPLSPPPHSAPHPHAHHPAPNRHNGPLLTTPLSTYAPHASSLIPAVQNPGGAANLIYTSEGYELYDSDSTGRPGTGHTNVSVS